MYAPRTGIGTTVLTDPLIPDPMSYFNDPGGMLVPTVVTTPGTDNGGGGGLPAPTFAPVPVVDFTPTSAPPPIPFVPGGTPAPSNPLTVLAWLGVAVFATRELTRRRGR